MPQNIPLDTKITKIGWIDTNLWGISLSRWRPSWKMAAILDFQVASRTDLFSILYGVAMPILVLVSSNAWFFHYPPHYQYLLQYKRCTHKILYWPQKHECKSMHHTNQPYSPGGAKRHLNWSSHFCIVITNTGAEHQKDMRRHSSLHKIVHNTIVSTELNWCWKILCGKIQNFLHRHIIGRLF